MTRNALTAVCAPNRTKNVEPQPNAGAREPQNPPHQQIPLFRSPPCRDGKITQTLSQRVSVGKPAFCCCNFDVLYFSPTQVKKVYFVHIKM
jgi:hypothetical protein